jgi:hypothetical protein
MRLDQVAVRDPFFLVDNPSTEKSPHGITNPRAVFPTDESAGARFIVVDETSEEAIPMLKVLDAGLPFGVTVLGPKLQLAPAGRLPQARVTGALNPF